MPRLSHDRTQIARLLADHFPQMADATSDDWHGFLNAQTGLAISPEEPNNTAFDAWRRALAKQDVPVWSYTEADLAAIASRGDELKVLEEERQKAPAPKLLTVEKNQ